MTTRTCKTCFYDTPTGRCKHPKANTDHFWHKIVASECYEPKEEEEELFLDTELCNQCINPGMDCLKCEIGPGEENIKVQEAFMKLII
jgi:hypothetical protein